MAIALWKIVHRWLQSGATFRVFERRARFSSASGRPVIDALFERAIDLLGC
jgi:hypothetical protein